MAFLITGATGFIGKAVVRAALEQGHKLAILTREPSKSKEIFKKDINNIKIIELNDFMAGKSEADAKIYNKVIHLAWADVKNYMDEQNLRENLEFQQRLLKKIISYGIKDITVAGTCLEYGMKEGACSEGDAPTEPLTSYAKAKHSLYDMLNKQPELKVKWLRFFYVYGVGSRANSLLSQLLKAIENKDKEFNMSPGDQLRDFINLETMAHNIVVIANQNEQTGIVNMGNGKPATVSDFVEEIMKAKGHNMKLNRGFYNYSVHEAHSFWADISKLGSIKGVKFDENIWL